MYCNVCDRNKLHVTRVADLLNDYYDEERYYHCDNCHTSYTRRFRVICDVCGSRGVLVHRGYNDNGSPRLLCHDCEEAL